MKVSRAFILFVLFNTSIIYGFGIASLTESVLCSLVVWMIVISIERRGL